MRKVALIICHLGIRYHEGLNLLKWHQVSVVYLRVEAWHDGAMRLSMRLGGHESLCAKFVLVFQPCWVAPLGPCFCIQQHWELVAAGCYLWVWGSYYGPSSPDLRPCFCERASAYRSSAWPQRDFKESFSLMSCDKIPGGRIATWVLTKLRSDFHHWPWETDR